MKYGIFTVFDKKLAAYMQPFFSPNTSTAIRAFADACQEPNSAFGKHPEDYNLVQIAEYEDQTAVIEPGNPVTIAEAAANFTELKEAQS